MEIITTIPINLEELADHLCCVKISPNSQLPRDKSAWHVTNLLESALDIRRGNHCYHQFQGEPFSIMSMGRIWEFVADVYLQKYASENEGYFQADQIYKMNDIVASFDGLIYLPKIAPCLMVVETKLRFTMDTSIPIKHERQMSCYLAVLHGLGISDTCMAAYVVLHIGARPPDAKAEIVIAKISDAYIAETWKSIIQIKECLISHGVFPNG